MAPIRCRILAEESADNVYRERGARYHPLRFEAPLPKTCSCNRHGLLAVGFVVGSRGELAVHVTREVQQRLHQRVFRGQVIRAYAIQCAVCRLRQRELLEAAHILSDTDPRGQPIIPNGLAMCSLHHAAYDTNVIGISPDYVIHLRGDVLHEHDAPMLQHGLQGFEQKPLFLPRRQDERPDRGFLEERFEAFRQESYT
jgi:HNH endonuclease